MEGTALPCLKWSDTTEMGVIEVPSLRQMGHTQSLCFCQLFAKSNRCVSRYLDDQLFEVGTILSFCVCTSPRTMSPQSLIGASRHYHHANTPEQGHDPHPSLVPTKCHVSILRSDGTRDCWLNPFYVKVKYPLISLRGVGRGGELYFTKSPAGTCL